MAKKPENETTDDMLQEPTDTAGITETQSEVQEVLQVNAQDNEQANAQDNEQANAQDNAQANAQANAQDNAQANAQDNAQAVSDELVQAEFTPRAVFVRLHDMHPHNSYGRAGYRFNKTEEVEILMSDLTEEQVLELNNDPWLECYFAM